MYRACVRVTWSQPDRALREILMELRSLTVRKCPKSPLPFRRNGPASFIQQVAQCHHEGSGLISHLSLLIRSSNHSQHDIAGPRSEYCRPSANECFLQASCDTRRLYQVELTYLALGIPNASVLQRQPWSD